MSVPSTESFTNPDSRQQTFDIELDRGSSGKAAQQQISMQQPAAATLWRRVLGVLCVVGIPIMTCASTEFGQYLLRGINIHNN